MAANPSIQLGTDGNWAIKEDNLLAYKKDGTRFFNKEFDFTRATFATLINKSGLIEKGRENFYLRSEEFDNSTWTKNGTSITANATSSPIGTNTADKLVESTSSNFHICYQNTSVTNKSVYTYSVYAKYNGRVLQLNLSSSYWGTQVYANFDLQNGVIGDIGTSTIDAQIVSVGNGWYRCSITGRSNATGTGGLALSLAQSTTSPRNENYTGDGTSGAFVWGAQGEQGLVATDYIETTTTTGKAGILEDLPRIDFTDDTTGHLLLEPQRTNVIRQSEYFQGWHTDNNVSYSVNNATSPEGLTNATKVTATSTYNSYFRQNVTTSAGDNVFSVFAKYEDCQYIMLRSAFFTGGDEAEVWFDIQNGVKGGSTEDDVTYDIEDYGNGWYRCYVVFNVAGDTSGYCYIHLSSTDESLDVVNGTSVHFYGAQQELGSYPTSYIPCYGSSVTRNADVCNNSGSVQDFNSEEGVLYAEVARFGSDTSFASISISDGSVSNVIAFKFRDLANQVAGRVAGASTSKDITVTTSDISQFNKFAISYSTTSDISKFYINGVEVGTISLAGLTVSGLATLQFNRGSSGGEEFSGKVRNVQVFKRAMSDGELYLLTVTQYQSYQEMATALNYTL